MQLFTFDYSSIYRVTVLAKLAMLALLTINTKALSARIIRLQILYYCTFSTVRFGPLNRDATEP